jgi:hypothetical protein
MQNINQVLHLHSLLLVLINSYTLVCYDHNVPWLALYHMCVFLIDGKRPTYFNMIGVLSRIFSWWFFRYLALPVHIKHFKLHINMLEILHQLFQQTLNVWRINLKTALYLLPASSTNTIHSQLNILQAKLS